MATFAQSLTDEDCTTVEVARRLGMAVRSVQLMVDRGELEAWRTPGGHRRIRRTSVDRWLASRTGAAGLAEGGAARTGDRRAQAKPPRVLLIEDSRHFQNLVTLLLRSRFPHVELHVADDGIAGLALAGKLEPEVLLVDILLPGIDGATLITGLRSHPGFARSRLIVVTSLEGEALAPYAFALDGLPVVHKPRLAVELPALRSAALPSADASAAPSPVATPDAAAATTS
jgi:excisionase family DNA binding protein